MARFVFLQLFKAVAILVLFIVLIYTATTENSINGYLLDIQEGKIDIIANLSILVLTGTSLILRLLFTMVKLCSLKCRKGVGNDFESVFSHGISTLIYLLINKKATLAYFILSIFINMAAFELLALYRNIKKADNILVVVSYTLLLLPLQILQIVGSINSGPIVTTSTISWSLVTVIYFLHITAVNRNNYYNLYFDYRQKEDKNRNSLIKADVSSWILTIQMFCCEAVFVATISKSEPFAISMLVCSWVLTCILLKFVYSVTDAQQRITENRKESQNEDRKHLMTQQASDDEIEIALDDNSI